MIFKKNVGSLSPLGLDFGAQGKNNQITSLSRFPGKTNTVLHRIETPAMSVADSCCFRGNFHDEVKTHFHLLKSKSPLWRQNILFQKCIFAWEEKRRISLLATRATKREQECKLNLKYQKQKEWIHFVGVGGSGLSALALLAVKHGFEVSGSDLTWTSFMDGLQQAGVRLHVGHSVSNIQSKNGSRFPNAVVVSSAIPQDNVEILHAKSIGVPVYKRDFWLAKLTEHHKLIAVSGSHGKSTTAGLLAYVLKSMGDDLTAVVGAHVPQFPGGNIIWGDGQHFVLEADEYDGCFLGLSPYIAVITNVDWEHVDIFQDEEAVKTLYRRLLKKIRMGGHLIICGDSLGAYSLLDYTREGTKPEHSIGTMSIPSSDIDGYDVTTYGISSTNEWHASSICPNSQGGSDYVLCHRGQPLAEISLQIPGVHNVLNSVAVIATVMALLHDQRPTRELISSLKLHLSNFIGLSRRFELIGEIHGCHIYDDYAHHPTEVYVVLQAARQRFPFKRLLVVFQPHTYSRLAVFKDDFAVALSYADYIVVTAVYSVRESGAWNVSGKDLAASIIGPPSEYIPALEDVVDKLALEISKDPLREIVILTLGAGDINTVGPKLLHELRKRLCKAKSKH
ncbi:hypothetical protein QUC31_008199 [Theobroma cacao]|uniref:UDP-N-acetylmuramate--L-alanine ligase n=2 Tax=Theobroma cacao TaxID=3641 RepID=A0A061G8D7_THECC|nr:PREDICTED: UDP-N-acetylmuramate--L-alanine ligase [Theobroma cacao]EOY23304.1 Uncharacterized protein TCM_015246 isoform 1 [Theobroma cacao]